jgi:hypothetical protein
VPVNGNIYIDNAVNLQMPRKMGTLIYIVTPKLQINLNKLVSLLNLVKEPNERRVVNYEFNKCENGRVMPF